MTPGRAIVALLLIFLGAILLAANLGWLDWAFVSVLWHLWPLVIVAIGIYLAVGRNRRSLAGILVLATFIIGVGVATVAWESDWIDSRYTVEEGVIEGSARGNVDNAELVMDAGALDLTIDGGGSELIQGEYSLRGDVRVADETDSTTYTLTIAQQGQGFSVFPFVPFVGGADQYIDLTLGEDVPWTLALDTGAASADIDLTGTPLAALTLDAGASSVDLRVGDDIIDGARVSIDGGAGSYDLMFPDSLTVDLTIDAGLSSTDVDSRFEEAGEDAWFYDGGGPELEVRIDAGVSSIDVGLY